MKERGTHAPVSHHDTEEDADQHARAYARGTLLKNGGETVALPDGSAFLIRRLAAEDQPTFEQWPAVGGRDGVVAGAPFSPGGAALGAFDAETLTAVGIAWLERTGDAEAVASVAVLEPARGRGLGSALVGRLAALAAECGFGCLTTALVARSDGVFDRIDEVDGARVEQIDERTAAIAVTVPPGGRPDALLTILRTVAAGQAAQAG